MKVLISDDMAPSCLDIYRKAPGIEVDVKPGLPPAELKAIVGGYQALAVRSATKVTAEIIEAGTQLKVIGRAGIGVDNIDVAAATRKGIVVMNTPGGSSVAVAELTLAHLLALARHLPQATASMKAGKWEKKKLEGHELSEKTLGVIGIGNIGAVVVERALALQMKVLAYDPYVSKEAAAKMGAELVDLDALLARSDFVSLHLPLSPQTRHLLNAQNLAKMKKGAYLVNCARGGIVDEAALAEALSNGHLAGAALDVFEKEPPDFDHPLFKLPNFICTPHLGASTEESQIKVAVALAEQIVDYLVNGRIRNAVNAPR
jgi:D-3-phosphoglycerate dehydrogenase